MSLAVAPSPTLTREYRGWSLRVERRFDSANYGRGRYGWHARDTRGLGIHNVYSAKSFATPVRALRAAKEYVEKEGGRA